MSENYIYHCTFRLSTDVNGPIRDLGYNERRKALYSFDPTYDLETDTKEEVTTSTFNVPHAGDMRHFCTLLVVTADLADKDVVSVRQMDNDVLEAEWEFKNGHWFDKETGEPILGL